MTSSLPSSITPTPTPPPLTLSGWTEHASQTVLSSWDFTSETMVPHPSSSFNCITLTLLLLPTLILTLYLLTSFPSIPEPTPIHPGLASLLKPTYNPALGNGEWTEEGSVAGRVRAIYGEDFWERRMREEVEAQGGEVEVRVEGGYVQLPLGRTRYWLLGPEDGEKIVLIHGLSVPSIIWKDVAPALALKGYRVLLYDLYGRGYTSSPTLTHSTSLYTTQLALLLQHLGFDAVNVVGISMGGGVAAAFCVQFPWLCRGRVGLLASAGVIEATDISRTSRFLSSPLMQLVTSSYPFKVYLRHLARTGNESVSVGRGDSFSELVRIQSAHLAGYNAALASSIRDGPIRGLAPSFAQLGRLVRKARRSSKPSSTSTSTSTSHTNTALDLSTAEPRNVGKDADESRHGKGGSGEGGSGSQGWAEDSRILLVWGTKDRVVPYHYAERVLTLVGGEVGWVERVGSVEALAENKEGNGEEQQAFDLNENQDNSEGASGDGGGKDWYKHEHARLITIEGAGHDLTSSHPELVVRLLDGFFRGGGT